MSSEGCLGSWKETVENKYFSRSPSTHSGNPNRTLIDEVLAVFWGPFDCIPHQTHWRSSWPRLWDWAYCSWFWGCITFWRKGTNWFKVPPHSDRTKFFEIPFRDSYSSPQQVASLLPLVLLWGGLLLSFPILFWIPEWFRGCLLQFLGDPRYKDLCSLIKRGMAVVAAAVRVVVLVVDVPVIFAVLWWMMP